MLIGKIIGRLCRPIWGGNTKNAQMGKLMLNALGKIEKEVGGTIDPKLFEETEDLVNKFGKTYGSDYHRAGNKVTPKLKEKPLLTKFMESDFAGEIADDTEELVVSYKA